MHWQKPVYRSPGPLHLCEDEDVTGTMFYVMSYEEGRVFWDPALPEIGREERAGYHRELIRVLAAIHEVDVDTCRSGRLRPSGQLLRAAAQPLDKTI